MSYSAKITRKGQVTIPRRIREKLGTDIVEFEWINGAAMIRPVRSLAGSLHGYVRTDVSFAEARDQAWTEVVREPGPDAAD